MFYWFHDIVSEEGKSSIICGEGYKFDSKNVLGLNNLLYRKFDAKFQKVIYVPWREHLKEIENEYISSCKESDDAERYMKNHMDALSIMNQFSSRFVSDFAGLKLRKEKEIMYDIDGYVSRFDITKYKRSDFLKIREQCYTKVGGDDSVSAYVEPEELPSEVNVDVYLKMIFIFRTSLRIYNERGYTPSYSLSPKEGDLDPWPNFVEVVNGVFPSLCEIYNKDHHIAILKTIGRETFFKRHDELMEFYSMKLNIHFLKKLLEKSKIKK
jgi:hypothetical protein